MEKEIKFKYNCEQCRFSCNIKTRWEAHIKTELHKTGKRKKRSDCADPCKCTECEYETQNKVTYKKHVLNTHSNKETRKKEFGFYCETCDFGTFSKDTMEIHNKTSKHEIIKKRNQ